MKSFIVLALIVNIGFSSDEIFNKVGAKFKNDKVSYELFKYLGTLHCLDKKNETENTNRSLFIGGYASAFNESFYITRELYKTGRYSKYPFTKIFESDKVLNSYIDYEKGSSFYKIYLNNNFLLGEKQKLKKFKDTHSKVFDGNEITQCQQFYSDNPKLKKAYEKLVSNKKNFGYEEMGRNTIDGDYIKSLNDYLNNYFIYLGDTEGAEVVGKLKKR